MSTQPVRSQVEAAYAAWDGAFNRANASAVAALYAPGSTFLPVSHDVIEGPAGVETFFAGLFANGLSGHKLELITLHEDVHTVVAAARWSAKGRNADGSAASFGGIATHVFERQPDGSLKLKLHIFN
jgi:ketosteroid isomerase-like protein